MKHRLLFAFCLLFSLMKSQILNPSFESVTAGKPDNYNLGFYSSYFIKDTNIAVTGTKAALIRGFSGQSYTVQGAVLGVFSCSMAAPAALNGWYRCNIQPGDSLVFSPYVYESGTSSSFARGYVYTTTSTAVYKQFSAPIDYTFTAFSSPTIGTIYTGIYLSGINTDAQSVNIPQSGTYAMIDDLSMGAVITQVDEKSINGEVETIYPQPAGAVAFMIYTLNRESVCSLDLYDISGKHVSSVFSQERQSPGRYKAEILTKEQQPGIYFAKLKVNDNEKVYKVVRD